MPAVAAKLPIIRKSGSVPTWLLVRKPSASVANALSAGSNPMISAAPTRPTIPMTAASGTSPSMNSHRQRKAYSTSSPICRWAQLETSWMFSAT